MIDRGDKLPVTRQCDLLDLSRSGVYYTPAPLSAKGYEGHGSADEICEVFIHRIGLSMSLQCRMVSQNSLFRYSGGKEKWIYGEVFRRCPRRNRCIEATAHPDDIACFHMVGKERFLGSQVMSSIGRQKTGKVLDGKNRMCS